LWVIIIKRVRATVFIIRRGGFIIRVSGSHVPKFNLIASIEIDHFIELVELLLFDSALFNESPGGIHHRRFGHFAAMLHATQLASVEVLPYVPDDDIINCWKNELKFMELYSSSMVLHAPLQAIMA
jgi:hypothetical protein